MQDGGRAPRGATRADGKGAEGQGAAGERGESRRGRPQGRPAWLIFAQLIFAS